MKATLNALIENFTASNTEILKNSGFKLLSRHTATGCAFLFAANKRTGDGEHIKECAQLVRSTMPGTSLFNADPNYCTAASFLSLSSSPDLLLENASALYERLKKDHGSNKYLIFAGTLLESLKKPGDDIEKSIERSKVVFDCLKSRHKLLTDISDRVMTLLLAKSEKSVEDIMAEVESTYTEIKPMGENNAMQLSALILARSDKPQNDKIARFKALYEKLRETKPKYGNGRDMLLLAVLAVITEDTDAVAADIYDVFNAMEEMEDYKGFFARYDKYTRLIHATMIVLADNITEESYDLAVAAVFLNQFYKYDIESASDTFVPPII